MKIFLHTKEVHHVQDLLGKSAFAKLISILMIKKDSVQQIIQQFSFSFTVKDYISASESNKTKFALILELYGINISFKFK